MAAGQIEVFSKLLVTHSTSVLNEEALYERHSSCLADDFLDVVNDDACFDHPSVVAPAFPIHVRWQTGSIDLDRCNLVGDGR